MTTEIVATTIATISGNPSEVLSTRLAVHRSGIASDILSLNLIISRVVVLQMVRSVIDGDSKERSSGTEHHLGGHEMVRKIAIHLVVSTSDTVGVVGTPRQQGLNLRLFEVPLNVRTK